ncbi:hypothetical protein O3M35_004788 [Rhynocoris fuscipes]|uniref:Major facilitator superfamily (MFS) profile domain-containing protein n=1 Tax=Rhynocoris fuscipes TaxID=488301 RepID=A0AAW1DHJ9_9HEMI
MSNLSLSTQTIVLIIVYISLLADNILLTVVVPIVPDYLLTVENVPKDVGPFNMKLNSSALVLYETMLREENGRVGLLLSSKAVVQLMINPIVGFLARYTGYGLPLFIGCIILLTSTLVFAFGETYASLFVARSLQGVASACIGVSGMSLVAENYTSENSRSKVMGIVLGSVAFGVLLGYPFGSFLYDFVGKTAPFVAISLLIILNIGLQLVFLDLNPPNSTAGSSTSWRALLSDGYITIAAGAIWLSSSAMAVLEPCVPLWLMSTIKPEKWELGTVFIPDSVGYLIGTNIFGTIAYKLGRWRVSIAAMLLVAVSSFMVPTASSISGLIIPHFGIGLGIGIVDAALVPLLATLVDCRHSANYSVVYALQQMAVSLAYALGPMIGGELVHIIGFPWLMRSLGFVNLLYCPLLIFLANNCSNQVFYKFFLRFYILVFNPI